MKKNKVLFLDRDGVVNKDVYYAHKPGQILFCDGIFNLCRYAAAKGYLIIIITNQAGVAKGHFTEEDVLELHAWMKKQFENKRITITSFYYCPYHKDGTVAAYIADHECRKPKPGMFMKAAEEFNIDFTKSLMVGDKPSDRIQIPELQSVILKSEYTGDEYDIESLEEVKRYLV